MRKITLSLLICFALHGISYATDNTLDVLISLVSIKPDNASKAQITTLLGNPARVEDGRKKSKWYYNNPNGNLVLYWNNDNSQLDKFSFTLSSEQKNVWDNNVSKKLRTGHTDLCEAIKLLGVPKDMLFKNMTQEIHYGYQSNVLRLFFRNHTLVDFTLY